jgi:hypothetical protein
MTNEVTTMIAAALKVPKHTTRIVIDITAEGPPSVEVTYLILPQEAGDEFVTVMEQFELRKKDA